MRLASTGRGTIPVGPRALSFHCMETAKGPGFRVRPHGVGAKLGDFGRSCALNGVARDVGMVHCQRRSSWKFGSDTRSSSDTFSFAATLVTTLWSVGDTGLNKPRTSGRREAHSLEAADGAALSRGASPRSRFQAGSAPEEWNTDYVLA